MNSDEDRARGTAVLREKADQRARTILAMIDEGGTYDDVSQWLGISRDSVRTTVYRARKRFGVSAR